MLVYGTANPKGFGSDTYQGLYLTANDMHRITPQMVNIPVKVEHSVSSSQISPVMRSWFTSSFIVSALLSVFLVYLEFRRVLM
jgi:hypothetical protein